MKGGGQGNQPQQKTAQELWDSMPAEDKLLEVLREVDEVYKDETYAGFMHYHVDEETKTEPITTEKVLKVIDAFQDNKSRFKIPGGEDYEGEYD